MKHHKKLIKISEANQMLETAETRITKHMLQYAYASLLTENQTPSTNDPSEPFDVAFFLRIIKYMVSKEKYIKQLIDGEGEESEWGEW